MCSACSRGRTSPSRLSRSRKRERRRSPICGRARPLRPNSSSPATRHRAAATPRAGVFPVSANRSPRARYGAAGVADMKGGVGAGSPPRCASSLGGAFKGSDLISLDRRRGGPPSTDGQAHRLALKRGERFDACLLGEPTSQAALGDTIKHGAGSLNGRLTLYGKPGHVAYPHVRRTRFVGLAQILEPLQMRRRSIPATAELSTRPISRSSARRRQSGETTSFPAKVRLASRALQRPLDADDAQRRDRAARRPRAAKGAPL